MIIAPLILLVGGTQDALGPLDLSVIGPPNDVRAHRARIITSPQVQLLLEMTAEQRANCAVLKEKILEDFQKPDAKRKASDGKSSVKNGVFRLIFDDNDKAVDDILDAKQQKRLGQIQLQALGPMAIFRLECVAKHLDLSADQREKAEQLSQRLSREVSEIFKSALPDGRSAELAKHSWANRDKHVDLLSQDQLAKLSSLLGEKDGGGWLADFSPAPSFGPKHLLRSQLGDVYKPFRALFVDTFLDSLEVSPKERERLIDLVVKERQIMEARLKGRAWDLHDVTSRRLELRRQHDDETTRLWKAVGDILGEKRSNRIKEAWRQVRGFDEVYSTTETSTLLKVSKAQQRAFSEFLKANRAIGGDRELVPQKAAAILTPEQRKRFEELKGQALPPHLITVLKSARAGVNCDEFGIPLFGIGAPP